MRLRSHRQYETALIDFSALERAARSRDVVFGLSDLEKRILVRDLDEIEGAIDGYRHDNPGVTFEPWREDGQFWTGSEWRDCHHPGQAKCFELLRRGCRFLFISSGNRWGKTAFAAKVITDHLLEKPGQLALIDGGSFQAHRDDIQKALWACRVKSDMPSHQRRWTPSDGFGREDPKIVYRRPEWESDAPDSVGIFRTYEQPSVKLGGIDATLVVFNEPPPMSHLNEAYLRIATRQGTIIIVATFVQMDSVYDHVQRALDENGKKLWTIVYGASPENPMFTEAEEKRLRASLSEEEALARLEGRPVQLGGRCYWGFRNEYPWTRGHDEAPSRRDMVLYEAIDCHPVKPIAYNLFGVDALGRIWVLEELWWRAAEGESLKDFMWAVWECRYGRVLTDDEKKAILRLRRPLTPEEMHVVPEYTIFDTPTKEAGHDQDKSMAETLSEMLGTPFIDAKRLAHTHRVKLVNEALIGAWDPLTGDLGEGTRESPKPRIIFVADRVQRTIQQTERVSWEVRQTEASRERQGVSTGRKQQVDEDHTDNLDYMTTMIMGSPKPAPTKEERPDPLVAKLKSRALAEEKLHGRAKGQLSW